MYAVVIAGCLCYLYTR